MSIDDEINSILKDAKPDPIWIPKGSGNGVTEDEAKRIRQGFRVLIDELKRGK